MKKFLKVFFALAAFVVISTDANTKNVQIDIGGVEIKVEAPLGFHEISDLSPETRRLGEASTPPTNRLLAVFISEEDLGKVLNGQTPALQRYLLLQTMKEMENQSYTAEQFRQLIDIVKSQQSSMLENIVEKSDELMLDISGKLSKEVNVPLQMKINEQVPLGVFMEMPNAIGFAALFKYRVEAQDQPFDLVVAAGITNLLIKGKVIFAYVYGTFDSQADIDWVRSTSKTWVNSILKSDESSSISGNIANKHSSFTDKDWTRVLEKGISGFIAGGILALLFGVFHGLRKLVNRNKNSN